MATIRKLRGRWQAQVRRRGLKPRCKSFDSKADAEKWARNLEAQVDRFGSAPDSRPFERGLNMIEVSSISGHKELRMLKRYPHLSAEDLVGRLG